MRLAGPADRSPVEEILHRINRRMAYDIYTQTTF
jgi:hypothetical protein